MEGGADGSAQSGLTYELLCEIAAYSHWDIEYVYGDFSDLYQHLVDGDIDILPNIIATDERRQQVLFHDLSLNEEHYFISALNDDVKKDISVSSLNGKRLATVKDALEEKSFDIWALENDVTMEKVYYKGFDEAWNAVRQKDADYLLSINNTAPGDDFMNLYEVGVNDVFFAIAKDREDILDDIDAAMQMIDDISPFLLSNLKQKYLNDSLSSRQLSAEEMEWVNSHDVLRIGGLKNDVPYAYENEEGEVVGTYVELTKMIFSKCSAVSLDIEWTLYGSMDELHRALKDGELDLICPEYHSYAEAELNGLSISETIMNIPMGILTLSSADSADIDVLTTSGTRPGLAYVKENFSDTEIAIHDTVDSLVKAVEMGSADAAIAHIYALQESIRGSENRFTLSPLSEPCTICYASLEQDHELIMLVNRGYHLIDQAERNSMELRSVTGGNAEVTMREFFKENSQAIALFALSMIAIIAYAINRTVSSRKLKIGIEQIRKQNEIIEASKEELEIAKEQAQASNKAKSAFLFNMSHDIRTPMNAIIGFNNMALSHIDDKQTVEDCLKKSGSSSKQLLSLIDEVLDMARIESGVVKREYEPVDIVEISSELIDTIRESVDKDLSINTDFSNVEHRFVLADKLHIGRILTNILGNSVKYTPDKGKIDFTINETSASSENCYGYDFIIEDNGIGMSQEFLEHVFEEFSREKTSTASGIQGTGLGMSITKRLVDLLDGKIDIKSKLGEGTRTSIHLEMETVDRKFVMKDEADDGIEINEDILKGKKVLLVEDNELNREIAEDMLSEEGMIVETVEDGDIAVEKMRNAIEGQYDVILMDIQMPRMNGYEATMAIRSLPGSYAAMVPIIAMTANAFEEDKQNAFASGMNGHLAKPIEISKLLKMLSRFL